MLIKITSLFNKTSNHERFALILKGRNSLFLSFLFLSAGLMFSSLSFAKIQKNDIYLGSVAKSNDEASFLAAYAGLEEVKTKRTQKSKTFRLADGSYKLVTAASSLHYMYNGKWHDIQTSITPYNGDSYAYASEHNSYKSFYPADPLKGIKSAGSWGDFKERLTQFYALDANGKKVFNGNLSVDNLSIKVERNKIIYENIMNNASLQYTQGADMRKFDIVIQNKQFLNQFPSTSNQLVLEEELLLPTGWNVEVIEGELYLLNNVGYHVAKIPVPHMHEALGLSKVYTNEDEFLKTGELTYELKGQVLTLKSKFDMKWLQAASRSFPVHLDPILEFDPIQTNFSSGYTTGTASKLNGIIRVTNTGSSGWITFDIQSLPQSALISSADYHGYHYITTSSPDKICEIIGMGNVDPISAASATIYNQIFSTSSPVYNDNYIFGGSSYQWRVGAIGQNGRNEIASHAQRGWTAMGFKYVSGTATFMYHYAWNSATNPSFLEVDYLLSDMELADIKPVTNFTALCKLSSYEVDVFIKNNGPGIGDSVDVLIQMQGSNDLVAKFDVSGIPVGQTRSFRFSSDLLIPTEVANGQEIYGEILSPDLDLDNNAMSVFWDVLSTPFGAVFEPTTDFPGFPRDGNRFNQDYITYNKTYTYDILPPSAYSNNSYGTDWVSDFSASLNGSPMPGSKFTYTPPQGANNASVTFELSEDDLNAEVMFSYVVTDVSGNGCDSTSLRYAVVMPTPKPGFSGTSVCEVDELQFVNTSTLASGIFSSSWHFGDGSSSALFEPKKRFDTLGVYDVKLVLTSNIGFMDSITQQVVVNPSPELDFTFINQCGSEQVVIQNNSTIANGTVNYFWDFGDGQTSELESPVFNYLAPGQYVIELTAESDAGCTNNLSKLSFSYPSPTADFEISEEKICAGSEIELINSTQIAFSNWGSEWFIDNKRTIARDIIRTFPEAGEKLVKLRVTTQFGCVDSIVKSVSVTPGPFIQLTHDQGCVNNPVTFNTNITAPVGMNIDFLWDIDGVRYGSPTPTHVFNDPGMKDIHVSIIYENGCESDLSVTLPVGYKPDVNFDVATLCAGEPILFENSSTIAFGNPLYTWDMGDGTTYNSFATSHTYTYTQPTLTTVKLIGTAANGACPDTLSKEVMVGVLPTCDFDIQETYLPGNRAFNFVANETAEANYLWLISNGRRVNDREAVFQFNRDGNYTVKLVVTTPEGCVCEKEESLFVQNLSASNLADLGSLKVYPNPSNQIFNIDFDLDLGLTNLHVYDALGKMIVSRQLDHSVSSYALDLAGLTPGVYSLKAVTKEGKAFIYKLMLSE